MLAGPRVIEETAAAYEASAALPFPRRLIAALKAGEDAGGDKRGKQSAALLIYSTEDYSDLDLRVDGNVRSVAAATGLEFKVSSGAFAFDEMARLIPGVPNRPV